MKNIKNIKILLVLAIVFAMFAFAVPSKVSAATVGYTGTTGSASNGIYNRINYDQLVVPTGEGGTVSSGSMYVKGGTSATTVYLVVYSDNGGTPQSLVAVSNGVSVAVNQAIGWVNFTFSPSFSITDGTTY